MGKPKIFVIYYSTYGHVQTLAQAVMNGLLKGGQVDVEMYQITETLPADVLEKMHAADKQNIPEITADKLPEADGFVFGFPTRFGTAPAQVKTFFDSTGKLWSEGALAGKPVGLFFSTASQHGGQEATAFTFMPHFAHHGMIYVPLGYASDKMSDNATPMGGSPWGSGTIAGVTGELQPSVNELDIAEIQGERFASVAAKLAVSKPAAPKPGDGQTHAAPGPAPASADAPSSDAAAAAAAQPQPDASAKQRGGRMGKLVAKFKHLFSSS
ncbi:hypothetical protein IW140_005148 [Coemansia sp. RSA 1813]|nr:hypothetical protein EV178_005125 [Coemansia sp. RSA 1646]KAJ1768115.1 hypothetical protein LPJ74_005014 [Coemansia sp. RSA 1843]KAJ2088027.1 hypothetical protein IW138_004535 [Coemansia sp. RSA 986]KAJ2211954.1 hypothetical protein EV179_005061 [Coemansia sp. RSA 487]KAJ2565866.1 hypothetical protein IW140_005148 [Coemansia sp. RSA 1813]